MLRLVNSVVGPVSVATGASGGTQTLEAFNAGDGSLSLKAAVPQTATWLSASVGAQRACSTTRDSATCIPLQFALNTASLAAGTYTAAVTVSDPNAVDAPQTVTVTVQVGGGVPASIDQFLAPGTTRDTIFWTNSQINTRASTQDGAGWLSLNLDGTGSFRFALPYRVHLAPPVDMPPGTYNGSIVTTGSSFAPDNKTVNVTMRVTSQPIAVPSPDRIDLRLAQGGPATTYPYLPFIALSNAGQGNLSVGDITAGGTGVSVTTVQGLAIVTVDPGSLAPGVYNDGVVTLACNAVNCPVKVPVHLEIVAKSAPLIFYQGVLDNGTFVPGDTVAQGDVMVVKGEQLTLNAPASGQAPPLSPSLGGATVLVNGKQAPLYYASFGQIAFQMPVDAPLGTALVQVQRDGQSSNLVSISVAERAPRTKSPYILT